MHASFVSRDVTSPMGSRMCYLSCLSLLTLLFALVARVLLLWPQKLDTYGFTLIHDEHPPMSELENWAELSFNTGRRWDMGVHRPWYVDIRPYDPRDPYAAGSFRGWGGDKEQKRTEEKKQEKKVEEGKKAEEKKEEKKKQEEKSKKDELAKKEEKPVLKDAPKVNNNGTAASNTTKNAAGPAPAKDASKDAAGKDTAKDAKDTKAANDKVANKPTVSDHSYHKAPATDNVKLRYSSFVETEAWVAKAKEVGAKLKAMLSV